MIKCSCCSSDAVETFLVSLSSRGSQRSSADLSLILDLIGRARLHTPTHENAFLPC